jgi:pimeloyl-ACP methyl ester carboxylesterase
MTHLIAGTSIPLDGGPSDRDGGPAPARLSTCALLTALFLCAVTPGQAQQRGPAGPDYTEARAVVEDLQRIVNPRGIQETYKARIGGIEQWIYVRGQDRSNPVLLFVHGGPASPMSPAMWQWQRPIEEYFTVVHWDQRGAGRTFREADTAAIAGTIRVETYVRDAIEITEHVRRRLGVDKVVLAGHSWGTIIGLKAALARPELYSAYVGIGQVVDSRANERLSYEYGLAEARRRGDTTAVRELESIAPYPGDAPLTRERIIIARKWPQHYGGLSAHRERSRYYFDAPLLSPAYDAADVAAIDQGNRFTLGKVLDELKAVDFTGVREFPIPVVMFMGRHDYTTPSEPTRAWLEAVRAPFKKGVWFENSAHMIPFEEPGKTLVSLLEHVRPLALRR